MTFDTVALPTVVVVPPKVNVALPRVIELFANKGLVMLALAIPPTTLPDDTVTFVRVRLPTLEVVEPSVKVALPSVVVLLAR